MIAWALIGLAAVLISAAVAGGPWWLLLPGIAVLAGVAFFG